MRVVAGDVDEWAECEQRVRGRSGARFKKAMTIADERAILREWGVSLDASGKPTT